MKKNKLVPKFRFPEFKNSPSWNIKKFDFQFLPTNTFSRSEMNNNKGIVKNIHYGDILIKYNYILDNTSLIPFINEDINLNKFTKESYLQNGDIIIADTAEDFSAGKAIEVQNINCKVLSGQHTFLCRPQTKYAPKFLGYYLNSPLYHNYLTKFLTGTKVYSINKTNIKNTFIIYPDNLEEQKKIADCLASIDELIEAEKRKLEALKKYKKALMQKLFPAENASIPELRFPEFKNSPSWNITNLGKISSVVEEKAGKNKYIPLSVTSGIGLISQTEKFGKEIAGNSYKNYIVIRKYDFAYNKSATKQFPEGFISMLDNYDIAAVPNSIFICFRITDKQYYPNILNYLFYNNYHGYWLRKYIEVGGRAHGSLNFDTKHLWDIPIVLPSLEEQQKIADCLDSIDSIIDSQVKKIDNLIKHKKALMQGLFPDMESIEDYE